MTDAVLKVEPQIDAEVLRLQEEGNHLLGEAKAMVISNNDHVTSATFDLGKLSDLKKALENLRKQYLNPLQLHTKAINAVFTTVSVPISEADEIVRSKVLAYQKEQAALRAEEERVNRLKQEAEEAEARLQNRPVEEVKPIRVREETPTRVVSDEGAVGQRMIWKFKIDDESIIPREYLMVDMVKIGKMIRTGVCPPIPGVVAWSEPILEVKKGTPGTKSSQPTTDEELEVIRNPEFTNQREELPF